MRPAPPNHGLDTFEGGFHSGINNPIPMLLSRFPVRLPLLTLLFFPTWLAASDVQVTELDDRIRVEIDGELFTEWRHAEWVAPYFYPVIGPNGENITRHYPMKEGVENEKQDHPHHRSLRFAHSDVNGVNFWYWRPGREKELSDAEIRLEKVEALRSGETGEMILWNRWIDGDELVLRERMRIAITPLEDRQVLMDYDVELHAPDGKPVTFGDMKDGGLYVRVAGTMKAAEHFKEGGAKLAGTILNSLGDRNEATWGRRAEWVDYFGPDPSGNIAGVALFDHPDNLRFPTHWHSRTYGLLAANRFGRDHFDPKYAKPRGVSCRPHGDQCPACNARGGDYTIPGGEALTLRHRLYFHRGDSESADVSGQYARYAGQEWTQLFDGNSFEGWEHGGNWVIEDGAFYRKEKGGSLTYTKGLVPDDFELRFDWKVSKGCNSGVYYRPAQYEYQILDNVHSPYGENARQAAGSLFFCMAPSKDATRPFGEWNTGRVKCKGTVIEHWVNGERVLSFDYTDPKWAEQVELLRIRGADLAARGGKLWLQDHGQPVWFRNLRWRTIPEEESLTADPDFIPLPVTGEAMKKEQDRVRRMLEAKKPEAK